MLELEKFKEIFIYNDLKKYLHNVIGNQLNIDFSKKKTMIPIRI